MNTPHTHLNSPIIQSHLFETIEDQQVHSTKLSNQIFSGSLLRNTTYTNVVFSNCVFSGCRLQFVRFQACNFENCSFEFSSLENCAFDFCSLKGIVGVVANAQGSLFTHCLMEEGLRDRVWDANGDVENCMMMANEGGFTGPCMEEEWFEEDPKAWEQLEAELDELVVQNKFQGMELTVTGMMTVDEEK